MIELNLLPDVKLEYIKAQRSTRLLITISIMAVVASVVLLGLLLSYEGLQKKHLNDLNHDFDTTSAKLKNRPDINKVLTVQNQLQSLTQLHDAEPAASRVFDYLDDVTPEKVSLSAFNIDFTQNTVTMTGSSDALSTVNKYIDTLKYTTYTVKGSTDKSLAFGNVVLGTFGLSSSVGAKGPAANFSISLAYDPKIFDITQDVSLSVPKTTTTRAAVDQPQALFQASAPAATGGTN